MSGFDVSPDHARFTDDSSPATPSKADLRAAEEGLQVDTHWAGKDCVIAVAGELDVATAPVLSEVVREACRESPHQIIMDLEQVSFIDSTGLAVLVSAHRRMAAENHAFVLVCHDPRCLKVMEITGLRRALAFAPTVEAALAGEGLPAGTA